MASSEEWIQVFRRRLEMSSDGGGACRLDSQPGIEETAEWRARGTRVAEAFGKLVARAAASRLGLASGRADTQEEVERLNSIWSVMVQWLREDELRRSPYVARLIQAAVGDVATGGRHPSFQSSSTRGHGHAASSYYEGAVGPVSSSVPVLPRPPGSNVMPVRPSGHPPAPERRIGDWIRGEPPVRPASVASMPDAPHHGVPVHERATRDGAPLEASVAHAAGPVAPPLEAAGPLAPPLEAPNAAPPLEAPDAAAPPLEAPDAAAPPLEAPVAAPPIVEAGSDAPASGALTDATTGPAIPGAAPRAPAVHASGLEPSSRVGEGTAAAPGAVTWRCLPVPEGPDPFPPSSVLGRELEDGLRLIGARVRGKKHKHEGTNCDDWFETQVAGAWTLIAVSDGAGSKKLSRVGARVATSAAIKQLARDLEQHGLREREQWTGETLRRDERTGAFVEEDLEHVQDALHRAMEKAYAAIEEATAWRQGSSEHRQLLGGRPPELNDFSATLLLAVHTLVRYAGADFSFVLACQIGDGMMAFLDHRGQLTPLGTPDSGAFSGETEFLTSRRKLSRDNLWRKTVGHFARLRALMVMTDGVADDYFPSTPELSRLYADLVLNRVLELEGVDREASTAALAAASPDGPERLEGAALDTRIAFETESGVKEVTLRSAAAYADALGMTVSQLVAAPALLLAGAVGEPVGGEAASEARLRLWLDAYQVRGSFDDRTLVVLYREKVG